MGSREGWLGVRIKGGWLGIVKELIVYTKILVLF
jgi:hypothetical protein